MSLLAFFRVSRSCCSRSSICALLTLSAVDLRHRHRGVDGLVAAGVVAEVEERPAQQHHDRDRRERADHVFPVHQSSALSARSFPDYAQLEKSRLPLVAIASSGRAGAQRVATNSVRRRSPVQRSRGAAGRQLRREPGHSGRRQFCRSTTGSSRARSFVIAGFDDVAVRISEIVSLRRPPRRQGAAQPRAGVHAVRLRRRSSARIRTSRVQGRRG